MKQTLLYRLSLLMLLAGGLLYLNSCEYKSIGAADYPSSFIYMTTAAAATKAPSASGLYDVSSVADPGTTSRYTVDNPGKRFSVLLGVGRSGVNISGSATVTISLTTDTLTTLKASGLLDADTDVLPADKITVPPTVLLASNSTSTTFTMGVNLDFLLANPTKKYAAAVKIASSDIKVEPALNTTIVLIDATVLVPAADFTSATDATAPKTINFTNASVNGLSYTWDFGDGSPPATAKSPAHTYAKAGSYTVVLTTTGITGITVRKAVVVTVV